MTAARLFRSSLENPTLPLTSTVLAEWLGGGRVDAGVVVSEQKVYGLPAYYRGVAMLAGVLAGIPVHVFKNGTRERVAQQTVLDNPNPAQTPFEFRMTTYANAIAWGNGFGRKVRNRGDVVAECWPIHPSHCSVTSERPSPANRSGKVFNVTDLDGTRRELTDWDMFHLPYLSLDGVQGIRPLKLFRQTLGISLAAEQTAAKFYGSGMRLSGILSSKNKLTEDSADRLKKRWRERTMGPDNAGEVAVLDNDTAFQPLAIPPQDAQLLDSRKWSVTEISRMIGLPPHLLGDVEKSTSWGSGIEQQQIGLVVYTAQPWLQLAEQRYTREFLPGGWSSSVWFAEHTLEGLLRGDSQARAAFYAQMIQWGVFSRNEVRALENREAVDGLEDFLTPSNMVLVSVDGSITSLAKGGPNASNGNT